MPEADAASTPRYRITPLRAGRLLLDAGGMFGVIPKVVWQRTCEVSEKNQVELAHNCLLLDPVDGQGTGPILLETGSGDKLDPKMRAIFGFDGQPTIEDELRRVGRDPGEVRTVIPSHLHFDHAGGLTRRPRPGETPDWTASDPSEQSGDSPGVKFTFPNAQVITQRREWIDAVNNTAVMTRTYYKDHLLPFADERHALLSGDPARPRLRLVDSPHPFPRPGIPMRADEPQGRLEARETEVLPGVFVFLVPGHTWGQQATRFTDERGRTIVFTPDVMPTRWHVGQAYSLAYDVETYTSMLSKTWFLREAAARGWTLFLDHEPGNPFATVREDGKGWYTLDPAVA